MKCVAFLVAVAGLVAPPTLRSRRFPSRHCSFTAGCHLPFTFGDELADDGVRLLCQL
jgi:hypothetical protein